MLSLPFLGGRESLPERVPDCSWKPSYYPRHRENGFPPDTTGQGLLRATFLEAVRATELVH